MPRIPAPPSGLTGPVAEYLTILHRALESLPTLSKFSGATPNGVVMGYPGDLTVNLTSANSDLRLYQKGGSTRVPSTNGWVLI